MDLNRNKKRLQKRMAVINDISGFGRCSTSVALPIISAMKVQCCVMPTAILSAHTGFVGSFIDDYTSRMRPYMKNWKDLNIEFDGICSGFLGSKEQIQIVIEFFEMFKRPETVVIVDPVMGDYGRLYSSYTDEMCREMKKLLPYADVLTPNLTEACRLLDIPYDSNNIGDERLLEISKQLCDRGPKQIVITGLWRNDKITNFLYCREPRLRHESNSPSADNKKNSELNNSSGTNNKENLKKQEYLRAYGIFPYDREYQTIDVEKIGDDRSGTGDVFTSILSANIVKGVDLYTSVKQATEFISKSIKFSIEAGSDLREGLCFEQFLDELC